MITPHNPNNPDSADLLHKVSAFMEPEAFEQQIYDLHSMQLTDGGWPELPSLTYEHCGIFVNPGNFCGRLALKVCGARMVFTDYGDVEWSNDINSRETAFIRARSDFKDGTRPELTFTRRAARGRGAGEVLTLTSDPENVTKWLGLFVYDLAVVDSLTYRWDKRMEIDSLRYNDRIGIWTSEYK